MPDTELIARLREQLARERAARLTRRELQRMAAASAAASTLDDLLAGIVEGVGELLGAHVAAAATPVDDRVHIVQSTSVPADRRAEWSNVPMDAELPLVRALEPDATWIELPDPQHLSAWPLLREWADATGTVAHYAVPLRARQGSSPIATLGLGFPTPTTLDGSDRALLGEVCELAADAIVRTKELQHTRSVAEELQASLLPAQVRAVDGLALRTLYQPGIELAEVGGDWYDVIEREDGSVALVVGDVAGHDMRSAAQMGRVRHVLASQLFEHADPTVALTHTDRYFHAVEHTTFATAIVVVTDADRSTLTLASAAHLPPLSVTADGVGVIAVDPGPPIGSGLGGYHATTVAFDPGDAVVAFTDGLVERRDQSLDDAMSGLAGAIAASGARSPADLLRVMRARVEEAEGSDDTAILLAVRAQSAVRWVDGDGTEQFGD